MSGAVSNHTMRVGIGFVTRLSVFTTRSCDFNLFPQDCRLGHEVLPTFNHFCETCFSAYLRQFFCCRSIFASFSLYLQRRRPFLSAVCGRLKLVAWTLEKRTGSLNPHVDFPMWTSNFWSFTKEALGKMMGLCISGRIPVKIFFLTFSGPAGQVTEQNNDRYGTQAAKWNSPEIIRASCLHQPSSALLRAGTSCGHPAVPSQR